MRSNYRIVGDFIKQSKLKNEDGCIDRLLGVNLDKKFMPSVANLNGVDLTKYKVIKKGQFGCKLMSVGRDKKVPISRLTNYDEAIISSAYFVFEVIDENELNPEYLMMWFSRSESDRFQWFQSGADIRGRITWEEFCSLPIKVPSLEKQREIVKEYNTIVNRIKTNDLLNQKIEKTAQTLFSQWFIDFEFPNEKGQPYKSSGGKMVYNEELDQEIPEGWNNGVFMNFAELINGYAFKSDDFSESGSLPILKIKNVQPPFVSVHSSFYYKNDMNERLNRVLVNYGDVLITMTGSGANQMNSAVGQVGKYYFRNPSLLNQRVCKLLFKDVSYSQFAFLFLSRKETQLELLNGSSGSANQANISPDQIRYLKLISPPNSILKEFERLAITFENAMRVIQKDKLKELEVLLLSKMSKVEFPKTEQVL